MVSIGSLAKKIRSKSQNWAIEKEKTAIVNNLSAMPRDDPERQKLIEELKLLDEMTENHKEGKSKRLYRWLFIGETLIIGLLAYKSDIGDVLNRNKLTQGWIGKLINMKLG